ncbi:MAG: DUF2730 family protein [Magnetospirillum sp.]|nr:DUF2730 family protein [Magnetospirillum sp.]
MTHADWIDLARLAWEVIGGIAVLLCTILTWSLRTVLRQMATKSDLQAHKAEHAAEHDDVNRALAEGDVRFAKIETTLAHLPQRADIDSLAKAIAELGATTQRVAAKMDGVIGNIGALQTTVNMLVRNELEGA